MCLTFSRSYTSPGYHATISPGFTSPRTKSPSPELGPAPLGATRGANPNRLSTPSDNKRALGEARDVPAPWPRRASASASRTAAHALCACSVRLDVTSALSSSNCRSLPSAITRCTSSGPSPSARWNAVRTNSLCRSASSWTRRALRWSRAPRFTNCFTRRPNMARATPRAARARGEVRAQRRDARAIIVAVRKHKQQVPSPRREFFLKRRTRRPR